MKNNITGVMVAAMVALSSLSAQEAYFIFTDAVNETGDTSIFIGDLAGGRLDIMDVQTGEYKVTWYATNEFPFSPPLLFQLKLENLSIPGSGVVDLSFSWPSFDAETTVEFSGVEPALSTWEVGDLISTNGTGFTSGIFSELIFLPSEFDTVEVTDYLQGPQPQIIDSDGDGIPDGDDPFPNSDLADTITIDGSDTGIPNVLDPDSGSSLADLVGLALTTATDGAKNEGQIVQAFGNSLKELVREGLLTGKQRAMILSLVAGQNPE